MFVDGVLLFKNVLYSTFFNNQKTFPNTNTQTTLQQLLLPQQCFTTPCSSLRSERYLNFSTEPPGRNSFVRFYNSFVGHNPFVAGQKQGNVGQMDVVAKNLIRKVEIVLD